MSNNNILVRAKQGNPQAINLLIGQRAELQEMTTKVVIKDSCLNVLLESEATPDQQFANSVYGVITTLGIPYLSLLKVYGRKAGQQQFSWVKNFNLTAYESVVQSSSNQLAEKVISAPSPVRRPAVEKPSILEAVEPARNIKESKTTARLIKGIAILEILGGLLGIGSNLGPLVSQPTLFFEHFIAILLFTTLYILSVLGGVWLWQRQKRGYWISQIVQFCQILQITATNGISFIFVSGLQIGMSLTLSRGVSIDFFINAGSQFYLAILNTYTPENPSTTIGINFLALMVLTYLSARQLSQSLQLSSTGPSAQNSQDAGLAVYDIVANTVGMLPTFRKQDNLFQAGFIGIATLVGAVLGWMLLPEQGILLGILIALILSILISGFALQIVGLVRAFRILGARKSDK